MSNCNKSNANANKGILFCFTDFKEKNLSIGYNEIYEEYKDVIRFIAWGKETCPTTKKQHNQGFIQMFKQCRYSAIQKMFASKCHFEVCKGSIQDNDDYCSKEGNYTKLGTHVSRGYRSDLHNIKDDLENGASLYDIMSNYTGDYVRYHQGIKSMKCLIDENKYSKERRTDINVEVRMGKAEAGKTQSVLDEHPDTFVVNYDSKGNLFDGYNGQKVILFDDFNGQVKYTEMLRILHEFPYRANVKYGYTYAQWNKVYITSNVKPAYWYNNIYDNFKRRIHKCLEVIKRGNTEGPFNRMEELKEPWERSEGEFSCEYGVENDELLDPYGGA